MLETELEVVMVVPWWCHRSPARSAVAFRVLFTEPLTHDDLHEIGRPAYRPEDPGGVAAELAEAVDQGRIADPADNGFALILAAEIAERGGDSATALGYAERAVAAYRAQGNAEHGYPKAFYAELLMKTGREDEAMAELAALRPLLNSELDAADYITEAWETSGHAEVAVQWLTEALDAVSRTLATPEPAVSTPTSTRPTSTQPTSTQPAIVARTRRRVRAELGLSPDAYDELAENMQAAIGAEIAAAVREDEDAGTGADEKHGRLLLFWPQAELGELLERWPELADSYTPGWDEYRGALERTLVSWSDSGSTELGLLPGSVAELVGYAARHDGDPADLEIRSAYANHAQRHRLPSAWPPERNAPCWCGSGVKYKKCCRPRSRS